MLKLRRGSVVSADPLTVAVEGEERPAWADPALVGVPREGDEVVVNVEAVDLGLGSGGFDLVHVNLSALDAPGSEGIHVMKLNYSSLQHPVDPLEPELESDEAPARSMPVAVFHLHGQLAPMLWSAAQRSPDLRIGYVQTAGGALPGTLSRDLRDLSERGVLAGHVTAGASYGGEHEAITTIGALDAAARTLGWDACVAGPGPGILGSASRLGNGGLYALESAHNALALGLPTLLVPRMSSADPRPRHRGLSHHTRTVLELLLAPVRVPVPETSTDGWPVADREELEGGSHEEALADLIEVTKDRHDLAVERIDLEGYAASGLPSRTMGRELTEDPLFFAAALAGGAAVAEAVTG